MKKILIILLLLFTITSTYASSLNDSLQLYYTFDGNSFTDATGQQTDLSNYGTSNTSGIINDARDYDGVNDYLEDTSYSGYTDTQTTSFWVYFDSVSSTQEVIMNGNSNIWGCRMKDTNSGSVNGQLTCRVGSSAVQSEVLSAFTWYHVVHIMDSGNNQLYIDGVLVDNDTQTFSNTSYTGFDVGRYISGSIYFNGRIDELAIWKRGLNSSEVSELYNSGNGSQYPFSPPAPGESLTINNITANGDLFVNNSYINSNVINFTINFNYINDTENINDSTSFQVNNSDGEYTFNLNVTYNNITTSTGTYNYIIDTTNPVLTVNFPSEVNNYIINLSEYITVNETNIYTCIVEVIGVGNTSCEDESFDLNYNGNRTINVYVNDNAGNTAQSLNNIILVNPEITFNFQYVGSNVEDYTFNSRSDTSGFVTFDIYNDGMILGQNNWTFEKFGFITQQFIFTITNTTQANYTFNVNPAQINVNIFDRVTGALLTQNVTLQLIGSIGDTVSTTTGQTSLSAINGTAGNYQIIATSTGYETESVYFTFTSQENLSINIYMINATDLSLGFVTIEVKDSLSFFIEGAIVSLIEWNPSQSAYITTAQCQTVSNGKCNLNIELNNKLYRFQAVKDSESTITTPQTISETGQTIPITLQDIVLTSTANSDNIISNMSETINNATNTSLVRLQWQTLDNTVAYACIKAYSSPGFSQSLIAQNCTSSSSGILFMNVNISQSYTIAVEGTVEDSFNQYLINRFKYEGTDTLSKALSDYNLDLLIPILFFFIGVGVGLLFGNIYIAVILGVILEWMATLFAPNVLSVSMAVVITFISGLIIWGVYKK